MLFTSATFLTRFLPLIAGLDWSAESLGQRRARWVALLLGSFVFYSFWRSDHLALLIGSILFNYGAGEVIAKTRNRVALVLGIGANLALLGVFKYAAFFIQNAIWLLDLHGVAPTRLALPLGISFFTFTQIAYLADCARGQRGEHGIVEYALFVAFFPHLLAGPIVHHSEMIPQFLRGRRLLGAAASDIAEGSVLFAVGAAKKLLMADPLAPIANGAFDVAAGAGLIDPGQAWLGALAYTFQLYFDFSGYSDMAIGLARIFGVRFPHNFDSPYKAVSIVDFWRRWHMTLSRWLRDYLYIPLGGNRGGPTRRYRNLMITMLLGGLWHGANWNFVIWGGLHGLGLVINHLTRQFFGSPTRRSLGGRIVLSSISWSATFLFVVLAWVFFRAANVQAACAMLDAMARALAAPGPALTAFAGQSGVLLALAALIAFLAPNSLAIERALASRTPLGLVAAAIAGAGAVACILASLSGLPPSPFLYFTF